MKQYERQNSFEKELEIRNITPNDIQSYLDNIGKRCFDIIFVPIQVFVIILAFLPIERTNPNTPPGYYLIVSIIMILMIEGAKLLGKKFIKGILTTEMLKQGYNSGNTRSIVTLDKVEQRVKKKKRKIK